MEALLLSGKEPCPHVLDVCCERTKLPSQSQEKQRKKERRRKKQTKQNKQTNKQNTHIYEIFCSFWN